MPDRTPPSEVSLSVRFWSRCEPFNVRDPEACALWLGHTLPAGYGTLTDSDGTSLYAHRVSWELIHGPIPAGHVVHHLCSGPQCVRPSHLQALSPSEHRPLTAEAGRTRVLPPLTSIDVEAMRHMYQTRRWSQGDLALLFFGHGSGQPIVQRIVSGESYKSVGGPLTNRGRGRPPDRRST